jgi:hypothetical protein
MVNIKNYQTDLPCLVCCTISTQRCFHHVKSRGSGGSDESYNLMPLCFKCHEKIHRSPLSEFSKKHTRVKEWLESNGWVLCPLMKRWTHD